MHAPPRPRLVIAGGSGFLGRAAADAFRRHGYDVVILSRTPQQHETRPNVQWRTWDACSLGPWAEALDGADVVLNLVGRSVDCRKTERHRREIFDSRINSCRVLGEAMRQVATPPPVWIQAATAHIVGDPIPEDTICDERTPAPEHGLAPAVGRQWEAAFDSAKLASQRGITLRTSFVLGPNGGAMQRLTRLTKLGLGGTVGSGRQWISWIHIDDFNRLLLAAAEDTRYQGIYMVTSPNPVTNRVFMRALRHACSRPWSPPAPSWAVRFASRWLLHTDADLALLGRRCVPTRLLNEKPFTFEHTDICEALSQIANGKACANCENH